MSDEDTLRSAAALLAENLELREALKFYASRRTYAAVSFVFDPPCGEFVDDFDEMKDAMGDVLRKPGRRARVLLRKNEPPSDSPRGTIDWIAFGVGEGYW